MIEKIFEGETLIRKLQTNPLQIFLTIILSFQVIVKSIKDPDDDMKTNY